MRCTSALFHTRPQAVKYPLSTDESDRKGSPQASIRKLITVRASPIQRKPTGSAKLISTAAAAQPKSRLYMQQRNTAVPTAPSRPEPISSATMRVAAKRMPLTASVVQSISTLMTSWKSPMPVAPMRPASQAWKAMPIQRMSSDEPVSSAVL